MSGVGVEGAKAAQDRGVGSGPAMLPQLRNIRNWDRLDYWIYGRQFGILIVGLFFFSLSLVMSLQSNLGANSWTVLHDGMAGRLPITIGQASQCVGLIMLAVSWVMRIRPGLGTVLNMILVGVFMDVILWSGLVSQAEAYPVRVAMLLGSLGLIGIASGVYIMAGFGAGPRDSFNLALTEMTGLSVSMTRWMLETAVVVIGIALGGSFGIGTVVFAILIGPSVGFGFRICGLSTRSTRPAPARVQPADAGKCV